MLKQTAPHEWEIVPTPFPKELKDESGTVLNLARIGFVYQGFDGNFHSFIRRYTYGKPKPVPEDYSFEELLVYGTEQSILIGYVHSHYDGQYNFHRFTYNKIKSGIGYLLFEMQINELDKVKDDIDQTEQGEYERLAKPTNLMTGYAYRAKKDYIKTKYDRIRQFFDLVDLKDFGYDYKVRNDRLYQLVKAACRREQVFTRRLYKRNLISGTAIRISIWTKLRKIYKNKTITARITHKFNIEIRLPTLGNLIFLPRNPNDYRSDSLIIKA